MKREPGFWNESRASIEPKRSNESFNESEPSAENESLKVREPYTQNERLRLLVGLGYVTATKHPIKFSQLLYTYKQFSWHDPFNLAGKL